MNFNLSNILWSKPSNFIWNCMRVNKDTKPTQQVPIRSDHSKHHKIEPFIKHLSHEIIIGEYVLHVFPQVPTRTPHLAHGVSGGTIPASSPASRPAATHQLKPAPPSHSESRSVTLVLKLWGVFIANCWSLCRVEGCLPVCPPHMVLDEVTRRCVYVEDCEYLTNFWFLVKTNNPIKTWCSYDLVVGTEPFSL